jgi:hypothetical protein
MDPEGKYDPDCDVSRFLTFPDPPLEGLMLSPCTEQLPMPAPTPAPALSDQPMFDANATLSFPSVQSGMNILPAPVTSVKRMPLTVEGVIISAMEGIHIEGSSSSTTSMPIDEDSYTPIFEQYLPGQKNCTCCIILRELTHRSRASELHIFFPKSFKSI